METKIYRCLLISDFTIDNFAGLLSNDEESPEIETFTSPFGQVLPVLIDENNDCWKREYDFIVVWTRPQAVVESFNDILRFKMVDTQKLFSEVDNYLSVLSNVCNRVPTVFLPTWITPSYNRGFGMLDMNPSYGVSAILMKMNLQLSEYFGKYPNTFVLDSHKWVKGTYKTAFNPKMWYMGKIPFSNELFSEAVKDIKAAMNGIGGLAKKLIITDLDDTLWGGIVGDLGWENINLGGHNAKGEAFVDFQKCLKALTNRGILIGIVSKNEEKNALEAIEKHPEMVLKKNDFAGWRINWNDKARNIVELVEELNLGLQSVVFLDDNPVERDRVRAALPEVFVPELPKDKMLYVSTLQSLRCFDTPTLSQEDLKRSEMYLSERKRTEMKNNLGSINDWLKNLQTKVKIEPLKPSNLERTTQLLNKTNQMNLSTRRLAIDEIVEWDKNKDTWLRTFRVSDKLGDSGLTGIVSLVIKNNKSQIFDFILSCRVMGRKIEEIMIYYAIEKAKNSGVEEIYADYIPTKKNKPCFQFWLDSGFKYDENLNRFSWSVKKDYVLHDFATIEIED